MSRSYKRKTVDVFELHADYGFGDGFELVTCELSRREIRARKREYQANEPGTPLKIIKRREPITAAHIQDQANEERAT